MRRPTTAEAFLDEQEAQAIERVTLAVNGLGDDLCAATAARERIRAHPLAAVGLGALAGFVGGPTLLRAMQSLLGSVSHGAPSNARRSNSLPGVVLASVRSLRARR
ncbi:MAG: hypothetical protein IPJ77_21580 [Planctomycetes bacterium]|nr:hypothetical protein [Planctomycetota bacterium]